MKTSEKQELQKLRSENHDLKEQIENYIPRRRVRRVYKQLKKVLYQDVTTEEQKHIKTLKCFIHDIEINGKAVGSTEVKAAIEFLLSNYEEKEE